MFYTVIVGGFFGFFSLFTSTREGIGPANKRLEGGERRLGQLPTAANPHKRERKKKTSFFPIKSMWMFFFKCCCVALVFNQISGEHSLQGSVKGEKIG